MKDHAYDGRAPRVRGSDTSAAAADSIEESRGTLQAKVLRFIEQGGDLGATDDEIECGLGLRHQTASARRRELELLDRVRRTELRRKTTSGRTAAVYVAVRL